VQADANAGQVLVLVDRARLPRGRLEHIVDAAQTDGQAQQVAQELNDAAIRAAVDQRQPDDHLVQPGLGHRQLEQNLSSGVAGENASSNTARALCVCW
jgi:hypothetical protein